MAGNAQDSVAYDPAQYPQPYPTDHRGMLVNGLIADAEQTLSFLLAHADQVKLKIAQLKSLVQ